MRVWVCLGWMLVTFAAVGAADPVIAAPPQNDADTDVRADVYIDDSLEAHDKIERARRLARRERWPEAAALLEDASATAGDKLVQIGPLSYVGIQEYVADLVCRWPPMGIDAYRALVEDDAISALQSAGDVDRLESLVDVFDRYFCTATAAELADRIGQKAIEVGELALAERHYRRVLDRHPDARRYAEKYRAMVMLLQVMQGDALAPEPEDANLPVRWMGEDRTIGAVWGEVVAAFSNAGSNASSSDWPIFGGSPARNRAVSSSVDELGLLWRFRGFLASPSDSDGLGDSISPHRRRDSARHLSIQPVNAGDLIFVQHYREILALHQNTGAIAWRYRPDEAGADHASDLDDQPPGWDSVTVHGGRVYAALSGEVVPYYGYESAQHPPEMVCLDARTGRALWRTNHEKVGEAFAEVSFDSSPLVRGKSLYVVGRRRRSFGFEDCYLFRFRADDGSLESRTHLGSASTGTFGARRATMSIAALQGDTIYVCTNLGTVAAISALTGNVRWLRVYSRDRRDDLREVTWTVREVKPWAFNPILYENGRVFCLPIDAPELLILAEDDGRILHSIPKTDLAEIESVFGVRDDLLCGFGKEAFCYDLSAGAIRWKAPLANGGKVFGRGVWTDERLLVPTRDGLSTFRISDGARTDRPWDTNGSPGNLRALPGQLLVSGDGVL
ncbi:MAG: PQQ-binding-like beta-propeller repeat protein, partial [Planctomycetes bacterium]|nr:PQQ-binding-like beta-propeller repeat protein [Planctomycetota bacterium]